MKKFALGFSAALAFVFIVKANILLLGSFTNVTGTVYSTTNTLTGGSGFNPGSPQFQISNTNAGGTNLGATVNLQYSLDNVNFFTLYTYTTTTNGVTDLWSPATTNQTVYYRLQNNATNVGLAETQIH